MTMRATIAAALIACCMSANAAPAPEAPPAVDLGLTAAQIVEKNVAARGGLEAWRKVEAMAWMGHVQGETAAAGPPLPFVMELKRPNRTRFEISTPDKRFTRIFDGTKGWRVRPGGDGMPEVKAFSKAEVDFSRSEFVVEGPLIDYKAKGVAIKLGGLDEVEGRKAYLLEVALPGGAARRVWIDAETFLDIRSDRPSTNPLTKGTPLSVYYRDFRPVDGLLIPHTIETRAADKGVGQKIIIDRVALNPSLSAQVFAKPSVPWHRKAMVRIGGDAPMPAPPSVGAMRSTQ